jgi:hypothetical protein
MAQHYRRSQSTLMSMICMWFRSLGDFTTHVDDIEEEEYGGVIVGKGFLRVKGENNTIKI